MELHEFFGVVKTNHGFFASCILIVIIQQNHYAEEKRYFMIEQIVVNESQSQVCCDGGGQYGHPKIFLHFGDSDKIICPYCSREFLKRIIS